MRVLHCVKCGEETLFETGKPLRCTKCGSNRFTTTKQTVTFDEFAQRAMPDAWSAADAVFLRSLRIAPD